MSEFLTKVLTNIKEIKNIAMKSNQRRIIVLHSNENKLSLFIKIFATGIMKKETLLFVHDNDEQGIEMEKKLKNVFNTKSIVYERTSNILGMTFDNLIMDLRHNLNPDDIGRLVGVVKGGGLIFMILPDKEEINSWKTRFNNTLISFPLKLKDIENKFEKYFYATLENNRDIMIIDLKNKKLKACEKRIIHSKKGKIVYPKNSTIPRAIFKLSATQDQVKVLVLLEKFWFEDKNSVVILKSDRGRGKSSIIGLFISCIIYDALSSNKFLNIGITSPEKENTLVLFRFLKKGLKALGIKFKELNNVIEIANKNVRVVYIPIVKIRDVKCELLVVEEAASIPIPYLYAIIKNFRKSIFSSTIHGYEGAGRGFSIRFMKYLKMHSKVKVFEFEMNEPIRYDADDPVELWLFESLLLNAEPVVLNKIKKHFVKDLRYEKIDLLIDKTIMKHFFGIYRLAHYRNRPKDVALILNSPNHFSRCVKLNNKLVNSIHISKEGSLPKHIIDLVFRNEMPKGHMIPLVICRNYRIYEFGFLSGWRIVRIATHPDVMNKGIGSFAVREIEKEARSNNLDWIGVSFGSTSELLNFWIKNKFVPLHISFERNPISGEYSVILLKPLSKSAIKIVKKLHYEFRLKLLGSLMDIHFDIDHRIPFYLLNKFYIHTSHYTIKFTDNQKFRLEAFLNEKLPYEAANDVVKELVKYYFLNTIKRPKLSEVEEEILIMKCLLIKTWRKIALKLGKETLEVINMFRIAVKKLWKWFV